jgi:peptidoglycan/LPS O-acetylase OafA/YrhL
VFLPVRDSVYQWFDPGQYGVFVSFLVSGYIVPASLERRGSVRGFWVSRAFRLYPNETLVSVRSNALESRFQGVRPTAIQHGGL